MHLTNWTSHLFGVGEEGTTIWKTWVDKVQKHAFVWQTNKTHTKFITRREEVRKRLYTERVVYPAEQWSMRLILRAFSKAQQPQTDTWHDLIRWTLFQWWCPCWHIAFENHVGNPRAPFYDLGFQITPNTFGLIPSPTLLDKKFNVAPELKCVAMSEWPTNAQKLFVI